MKNPFASDRNIFSTITRPGRPAQAKEPPNEIPIKQPSKQDWNLRGQFRKDSSSNRHYETQQQSSNIKPIDTKYTSSVNSHSQSSSFGQRNDKITFGKPSPATEQHIPQPIARQRDNFVHRDELFKPEPYEAEERWRKDKEPIYSNSQAYRQRQRPREQPSNTSAWSKFQNTQQSQFVIGVSSMGDVAANKTREQPRQNPGGNKWDSMIMSPIVEKSKHKMDDEEEFLDIDAIGNDLGRILASSKNQQQLYQLLGMNQRIDEPPLEGFRKKQSLPPSFHKDSHRPQYSMTENRQNSPERPTYIQRSNTYQDSSSSRNPNYRDNDQEDQDVFDYDSSVNSKPSKYQASNKLSNSSGVDIQAILNKEMNKLSRNGNKRTFLSASDKIETIKYNLEHI